MLDLDDSCSCVYDRFYLFYYGKVFNTFLLFFIMFSLGLTVTKQTNRVISLFVGLNVFNNQIVDGDLLSQGQCHLGGVRVWVSQSGACEVRRI